MYKTLDNILTQLEDNKALDIISIDLKGKSDIADFLVIATGTSNRHVGSLSENLISELKKDGIKDIKAEGINKSDWVLIDSGDVIVHIFRKEVREFYNLEKLWQTNIDTTIKHSNKKNAIEKKEEETNKLIDEIKGQTLNILLDRAGTKLDSFEFSKLIFTQTGNNENIKFFIGGSEGIDQNYFNDFDKIISFGDLTWPHKMFKMMLLEQIYRSITIINKHPYHK